MSFSANCKAEMCRTPIERTCCARAEFYGCLLLGQSFNPQAVRIVTGHGALAERLPLLLERVSGLSFSPGVSGRKHVLTLTGDAAKAVLNGYGHDKATLVALHLNRAVLEDDCCMAAFMRGAFLTGGFAASSGYHLELVTPHLALSRELAALLSELGLPSKTVRRAGHQILYYKASESIEDFLTLCGAPLSAMSLMETKVEKDVRNRINRKVNCETANSAKAVAAAITQAEAFKNLRASAAWDGLSEPLKQAALARIENQEDTLAELAAGLGITKSGLNHRYRKLMELSGNITPASNIRNY